MTKRKKFKYQFKPIHLLVFAIILLILSLAVASKGGLSEITNLNRQNKVSGTGSKKERVEISGVKVADFIGKTSQDESPGYYTIAKTPDYHIFFLAADELFFISITSYPFDEHRANAEQKLLEVLAITEDDSCKLNVDITTPSYANPDKAGEVYNLSFCSNNN